MPPKIKITKQDIINTAIGLVRASGDGAINARAIASALNCSTQPIFSNFETMDDLRDDVIVSTYDIYLDYLKKEAESGKYPQYKSFGMAYIRFAKEEKELFKLLFMRDRSEEDLSPSPDFDESVQIIMEANSVSKETAMLIHLEMWSCAHGIGTMLATSFLPLELELVSDMMSDLYQGIKTRYLKKEDE
jgi:AcrR family transcriptional regulator